MQNYNYNIDKVKFLCAIAVVFIHLTVFIMVEGKATIANYYSYIYFFDIAVPFFFACSGYLLSQKQNSYMKSYAKKIFILYISFSAFYIAVESSFIFFNRVIDGTPFWPNLKKLFQTLKVGNFIGGTFGQFHLWYLAALFISVLLLYMLVFFKVNPKISFLLGFIIYGLSMSDLVNLSSIVQYGGFPKGCFYLTMGYYLGHCKFKIRHPFKLFLLFYIIYAGSNIILQLSIFQFILACATYFLIIYCIQNPGEESVTSKLGKHSLDIYILHVFVYDTFYKILDYLNIVGFNKNPLHIILLAIICIVISILLFKPIQYLVTKPFKKLLNLIISIEEQTAYTTEVTQQECGIK